MRYFLGLDVAKDSFAAALLDEAGQVLKTAPSPTKPPASASCSAGCPCRPRRSPSASRPAFITSTSKRRSPPLWKACTRSTRKRSNSPLSPRSAPRPTRPMLWPSPRPPAPSFSPSPKHSPKRRVSWNPARENLALWLAEYDRLRKAIATLRHQISELDHHAAPDAPKVQQLDAGKNCNGCREQKQVHEQIQLVYRRMLATSRPASSIRFPASAPSPRPQPSWSSATVRRFVPPTPSKPTWESIPAAINPASANVRTWPITATS